jgi:hypothetical protein
MGCGSECWNGVKCAASFSCSSKSQKIGIGESGSVCQPAQRTIFLPWNIGRRRRYRWSKGPCATTVEPPQMRPHETPRLFPLLTHAQQRLPCGVGQVRLRERQKVLDKTHTPLSSSFPVGEHQQDLPLRHELDLPVVLLCAVHYSFSNVKREVGENQERRAKPSMAGRSGLNHRKAWNVPVKDSFLGWLQWFITPDSFLDTCSADLT